MNDMRDPIAMIGMGCRFPGGITSSREFWQFLCNGHDAITTVPPERWNAEAYWCADRDAPGRTVSRWGGFVENVDCFDAAFFGIAPREAACMDPQQRWLLEVAYEAIEDAGVPLADLRATNTGVFIGISNSDYAQMQSQGSTGPEPHGMSGGALCMAANRVSYTFDLRGPSLAIDTACSSSLTALHLACQSLWRGECDLALVGGVNALLSPGSTIGFSRAGMLSPTGRTRAFAAGADGYVRAEGAGMVVLQLQNAVAAGVRPYALIKATAANEDGQTTSLTVPSQAAQEAVLNSALDEAGITPGQLAYIEAHATGTPVGDPVEAAALGAVVARHLPGERQCWVGSVKTNIGHLESAAGIAGLCKAALVLSHRTLVPNLHFDAPNPAIDFQALRLAVPVRAMPLERDGERLVACVNSFGFGGANACVVLEEAGESPVTEPAEAEPESAPGQKPWMLPFSARSRQALEDYAARYSECVAANTDTPVRAICAAAAVHKPHHPFRGIALGTSHAELERTLGSPGRGEKSPSLILGSGRVSADPAALFVFAGQGGHWYGMGKSLLDTDDTFACWMRECDRLVQAEAGWSLLTELGREPEQSRLDRTEIGQPVLLALQVALVHLWADRGIRPAAVLGHSVGEIAAAYTAGILPLPEAVRIVVQRSRLQQRLAGCGGMVALGLGEAQAQALIQELGCDLDIAAFNSPGRVTVAGDAVGLQALEEVALAKALPCRRLNIDCPFHSRLFEPLRGELEQALTGLRHEPGAIPMYSSVTAELVEDGELDATYWWRNLREPVRFADALAAAPTAEFSAAVEIGPHPLLGSALQQCLREWNRPRVTVVPSMRQRQNEETVLRGSLAQLYVLGFTPRWSAVLGEPPPPRDMELPRYPWQRERLWREPEESRQRRFAHPLHPFIWERVSTRQPTWQSEINLHCLPYLKDHQVRGRTIFPAAAYMEMALAVGRDWKGDVPFVLDEIEFVQTLDLAPDVRGNLQCSIEPDTGTLSIQRPSPGSASEWEVLARATVATAGPPPPETHPLVALRERFCHAAERREMTGAEFYTEIAPYGFDFGPDFQGIEQVWFVESEGLARIVLPENVLAQVSRYCLHPAAFDSCLQVLAATLLLDRADSDRERNLYLPVDCGRLRFYRPCGRVMWVHVTRVRRVEPLIRADITILNEAGERVADLENWGSRRIAASADRAANAPFHRFVWREEALPTRPPLPLPGDLRLQPGTWLLFLDEGRVGQHLAELLTSQGDTCILARKGEGRDDAAASVRALQVDDPDAIASLVGEARREHLKGIVYLWGLDAPTQPEGTTPQPAARAADSALGLLYLLQNLTGPDTPPGGSHLWIAAAGHDPDGAPGPGAIDDETALAGAALCGLARVARNEHPSLNCTLVELDPGLGRRNADLMYDEIWAEADDVEVGLYRGKRVVRRLVRAPLEALPYRPCNTVANGTTMPFRLESTQPGLLDRLAWRTCERILPGPGEVEVRVTAAALNFRDVLKALGVYPGDAEDTAAFGDEASGEITAVGPGVTDRRPGDAVVVMGQHCLAAYVTVPATATVRKPEDMSFTEAASVPVAFLTAWHALVHCARLSAGEKVLIHAASGGVGLAAVRIAQRLGAEVLGTAGSEEKREFLRQEGVAHVMDSRSLDFADEVLAATSGRGVDVVLNSLAGEFITRSLAVLAPGGRFIELGKRDIYRGMKICLSAFKDNRSFMAVDFATALRDQPDAVATQLAELLALFKKGELRPLPYQTFPGREAIEAFRFMSQAKHIGKVVLDLGDGDLPLLPSAKTGLPVRADSTYLISGGLGGFGLRTAQWLAQKGASNLVLFSSSGRPAPEDEHVLDELKAGGTHVKTAAVDVASTCALDQLMEEIQDTLPPLRGVVHAAMVLDDVPLAEMDSQSLLKVFRPKAEGAWNLHRATRDTALDFFVLYSSVSTVLGGLRQANYVAANAFLDALAHYRHRLGLPALSLNFGGIADAGYLARTPRAAEFLAQGLGIPLQTAGDTLAAIDRAAPRDVAQLGIFHVNWERARSFLAPSVQTSTFREFFCAGNNQAGSASAPGVVRTQILTDPENASDVILNYLRNVVAQTLGASPDAIESDVPLSDMGLDSLMAVELKVRMDSELGIRLEPGRFRQVPSLRALAEVTIGLVRDSATGFAEN